MILDIIGATSGAETSFLSYEVLIRKPRTEIRGQSIPPENKSTKISPKTLGLLCDAPNPGCPLTTRQPTEIYTSRVTRHTHE